MWYRLKTLRFKLILLHLSVFCIIWVTLSLIFMTTRENDLYTNFDNRLVNRATIVAKNISLNHLHIPHTKSTNKNTIHAFPYNISDRFIQLRLTSGEIIEKSRNLNKAPLPFDEVAKLSKERGNPVYETVKGDDARKILGKEGELRLLTLYHEEGGTTPFYIQVAADQKHITKSIIQLRKLTVIVIVFGLLLGAIGSWFLTRRSLAYIGLIAKEARELSATHLHQRLTIPPGQDEVVELVKVFNKLLDRLEKAFRAQETFLANAAHELKTPVSVLLGEAQVLCQKARTPEEYDRFAANVQDEMRRIGQIVNSMLILARTDAGFSLSTAIPVSINEIVTEAVMRCQIQAEQQEVRLVPVLAMPIEHGSEPEPMVDGDAELLRSAVVNLIRNAIHYSPPQESVEITVKISNDWIRVAVRDKGPGVENELIEQLFQRFYAEDAGEARFKGAGLGLAIVKGVTDLHKGRISVSNHPEGGVEFAVELPLSITE
ncbi:MAG: HAMP domain-containing protein [Planctomycetota bacterium]|nr:MAG: HAMP domain-containing protein [Planctomycetota bacterium]